jgi:hypothetical protein
MTHGALPLRHKAVVHTEKVLQGIMLDSCSYTYI